MLFVVLPKYTISIWKGLETVFNTENESRGTVGKRLSIVGHEYTNTLFYKIFFFGTGYINSWFSNREDLLIEHDLEGEIMFFNHR